MKFELQIKVKDAPQQTEHLLVRPEVRSHFQRICPHEGVKVEQLDSRAPGEAVVHATSTWKVLRLCSVMFGDLAEEVLSYLQPAGLMPWHQKVQRNTPRPGDSACNYWIDEDHRTGLLLTRPDGQSFTTIVVMHVLEDHFARWASVYHRLVLRSALRTAQNFLNRPGIVELRQLDQRFYLILSMQSFKRGMPLLPAAVTEEAVTDIDAGKATGLRRWLRYVPPTQKFDLAEYLEVFMARLGQAIEAFRQLDGQVLVPYQCAVRREQWEQVRPCFVMAYPLQKTAYRHANGGSGAPGIHEDVAPKVMEATYAPPESESDEEPQLIVRNTFLDIAEVEAVRPERRAKTIKTTAL